MLIMLRWVGYNENTSIRYVCMAVAELHSPLTGTATVCVHTIDIDHSVWWHAVQAYCMQRNLRWFDDGQVVLLLSCCIGYRMKVRPYACMAVAELHSPLTGTATVCVHTIDIDHSVWWHAVQAYCIQCHEKAMRTRGLCMRELHM